MELDLDMQDVVYIMNTVHERLNSNEKELDIAHRYGLTDYIANLNTSVENGERIIKILNKAGVDHIAVLKDQLNMALKTLDFIENCDPDAVSKDAFQVMAKGARCRIAEIAAKASLA